MESNKGYFYYTIKQNDTIYKLANQFGTTVGRIIYANPNINIYNLKIGSIIIIPVGNIVNTNISYNSNVLFSNLNDLKIVYPFLQIEEIGKSVLSKPLTCIKIGIGNKQVFYNGAFHANEWITTSVLMKFIEEYAKAFVNNTTIYGYNAKTLFYTTSLYIVPMVNPDGVDLVTGSITNVENSYKKAQQIANNFPNIPFPSGWKANINGVDFINFRFCFLKNNVVIFYTSIVFYI